MADSEKRPATRWPASRFLLAGAVIAGAGYLPLQLYIIFGPRDGNPIGLGLLFVLSMVVGLAVVAVGLLKLAIQSFLKRKD
jgi:hypothetical protein